MTPPVIDLDEYRDEIERQITADDPHTQIRAWLATNHVNISRNTFSRRLAKWNISHHS